MGISPLSIDSPRRTLSAKCVFILASMTMILKIVHDVQRYTVILYKL